MRRPGFSRSGSHVSSSASDGRPVGVLATSDLVRHLGRGHVGRGTVADVMSHGLVACRNTATVRQAARVMTERHVRALVVVAPDGRPLGVVTGTDLLPLVGADAGDRPVADLMHEPITIEPCANFSREVADLLLDSKEIHRLVVVDPDAPANPGAPACSTRRWILPPRWPRLDLFVPAIFLTPNPVSDTGTWLSLTPPVTLASRLPALFRSYTRITSEAARRSRTPCLDTRPCPAGTRPAGRSPLDALHAAISASPMSTR